MVKLVLKGIIVIGTIVLYGVFGYTGSSLILSLISWNNFNPLVTNIILVLIIPALSALIAYTFTRKILKSSFTEAKKDKSYSSFEKKYPNLETEAYKVAQWTVILIMLFDYVVNIISFFNNFTVNIQ
ncbi:MAG: hypothetical protein Q7S14_03325 [bacterium]|nr:hypothetical protein [bacterium]